MTELLKKINIKIVKNEQQFSPVGNLSHFVDYGTKFAQKNMSD